jgi:uncharacterized protein YecT (DUF1311 family)
MFESSRSVLFLLIPIYIVLLASLVIDLVRNLKRRSLARACAARIIELKRAVWESAQVGGGVAAEVGVLVARAERADRWARATELDAVTAMVEAGVGIETSGANPTSGQADHALDAEARLEKVLNQLRRRLPEAAGAELEASQTAFREYRDTQVRLCRGLREGPDRMLVRDYASEAITRARVSDLEDVLAIARLQD